MATKNVVLENTGWQDVEELASISFTDATPYTISIRGGRKGEVCVASSLPDVSFQGHPINSENNFTYTHTTGNKVFIKTDITGAILVIS